MPALACIYTYVSRLEHNVWDVAMFIVSSQYFIENASDTDHKETQHMTMSLFSHTQKSHYNCKLFWIWMSLFFFFFLKSVLFSTALKNCIFKLLGIKSCKQWIFIPTLLLQLCMWCQLYSTILLLAWQNIQKCCQSVKETGCSGISERQITSAPCRVSYSVWGFIFYVYLS